MAETLDALYLAAVQRWRELRAVEPTDALHLSAPLLIAAPAEYARAGCRVMIVGQQTAGWGETIDPRREAEDILAELQEGYRSFDLGAHYRPTPFWRAAHQVFATLNPGCHDRSFLWSNLYKIDLGGKRPPIERESEIADMKLLPAEIRTFSPHVVVFFTGPYYDQRLLGTFPGAMIEPVSKVVARVRHDLLPSFSFRTYHPKYLCLSRQWSALEEITSTCRVA